METIRSSKDIDRLFRKGSRSAHEAVIVLCLSEKSSPTGRLAFVAGKRLGTAVTRNRSKRVLRATARRAGGPWAGWDVVLIATVATADTPAEQLQAQLGRALDSLGVVP